MLLLCSCATAALVPSLPGRVRAVHLPSMPRTTLPCCSEAASLREQMKAYLDMVREKGLELTPDQQAMIAEMEADEELLDQRGLVDFNKQPTGEGPGGSNESPEGSSAPSSTPEPVAGPLVETRTQVDAAAAQLWLMQRRERGVAIALLQRLDQGSTLSVDEARDLRSAVASLISTLCAA